MYLEAVLEVQLLAEVRRFLGKNSEVAASLVDGETGHLYVFFGGGGRWEGFTLSS